MGTQNNHLDSKTVPSAATGNTESLVHVGSPRVPFAAVNLLSPGKTVVLRNSRAIAKREPVFLVPANFYRFRWTELLPTFVSREPRNPLKNPVKVFRELPVAPGRFAGKSVSASLVFHLLGIPLLAAMLQMIPVPQPGNTGLDLNRNEVVYYRTPSLKVHQKAPTLTPFGPESSPGSGKTSGKIATRGASANLGALYVISRPHLPDNAHQTILQPDRPAELRITNDLKLPNLVSARPQIAKPRAVYNANEVRPLQPQQHQTEADLPSLPGATQTHLTRGVDTLTVAQGRVAVPIGGNSAPILPSGKPGSSDVEPAPDLPAGADRGPGVIILGTDPSNPTGFVALPAGNRDGQFAIRPDSKGPGSPGGRDSGSESAGRGGPGTGEKDDSTGVGSGGFGGGGKNGNMGGFISLRGGGESATSLADPGPSAIAQLVFALPANTLLRHNTLVVSAGPVGGGGSNIYGELPCGRIYTVFLPTGSKQWPLQYCRKIPPAASTANKARTTVVHAEAPLLPPEAKESYDFKRMPLPPEKAHKLIILRGAIAEDGTVEEVEVHQGLMPTLDAAARLAFSQWKFRPAMQAGKPVRVEVLVAIPAEPAK